MAMSKEIRGENNEDFRSDKSITSELPNNLDTAIKVMVLNCGSRCTKQVQCQEKCTCQKGINELKRRTLASLLTSTKLHLIFCSEMPWEHGIRSRVFKEIRLPPNIMYIGGKETGFIYNSSLVELSSVKESLIDNIMSSMGNTIERARMCIYTFKIKSKMYSITPCNFLCIAWHGPHIKFSHKMKVKLFKELQIFVRKLQEKIDASMKIACSIIAGDFNLSYEVASSNMLPHFKNYFLKHLRTKTDFFLLSVTNEKSNGDWCLNELQKFDLNKEGEQAFDHDPLFAKFVQLFVEKESSKKNVNTDDKHSLYSELPLRCE